MSAAETKVPDALEKLQSAMKVDDFESYVDAGLWTKTTEDSGTVAAGDFEGGQLLLTTGATNNDQVAVQTTQKIFKFADRRAILIESILQFTEAATNAANVFFGLESAAITDILLDDGAGPATSFSGCAIYKVDSETVWRCVTSVGSTQQITKSGQTAGGTDFVKLGIFFQSVGDPAQNQGAVSFFLNDKPLYDPTDTTRNKPIKHYFDYTSAAAMFAAEAKSLGSRRVPAELGMVQPVHLFG